MLVFSSKEHCIFLRTSGVKCVKTIGSRMLRTDIITPLHRFESYGNVFSIGVLC